jgi:hypothetical protein
MQSFTMQVVEEFLRGVSVETLAAKFGTSVSRMRLRLRGGILAVLAHTHREFRLACPASDFESQLTALRIALSDRHGRG